MTEKSAKIRDTLHCHLLLDHAYQPRAGRKQAGLRDFTPLSILIREYPMIVVKAGSPVSSTKELAARLKKDPSSVSFSFAASRGNHIPNIRPISERYWPALSPLATAVSNASSSTVRTPCNPSLTQ